MKVGSLVKRTMLFDDWVTHAESWVNMPKYKEIGLIMRFGRALWDYEVLWQGEYIQTHDESEIQEIT